MAVDEYTKRKSALGGAERRPVGNKTPDAPPVSPISSGSIRKKLDVACLKSMTENELLDELKSAANAADAQIIMAELLRPKWKLVAGYWAVITGMVVMMIVVLIFQFKN